MRERFIPESDDAAVFRNEKDESADPDERFLRCAVRESLGRVLRRLLTTPREQSIYRALVYGDHSYEQLAATHDCSMATIANHVTVPLVASLQEILGDEGSLRGRKTSFRTLREPLAHSIPEDIFDELMAVRMDRNLQSGI